MSDLHGLSRILEQIGKDAAEKAAAIEAAARAEADQVIAEAQAEADDVIRKAEEKAAQESEHYAGQRRSGDEQQRKLALLKVRNDMVNEVLDAAKAGLLAQGDEEYFGMLLRFLSERVSGGAGVLHLNARDLSRMPADFAGKAAEAAAKTGGTVTVSGEPADIDGGFILTYGDIEENCSLEAIFAARREEFRDRAHEILFA